MPSFFVPETAYAEAEEHLPALIVKRGGDPEKALAHLDRAAGLFRAVSDVAGAARSMLMCGRVQLWMGHPATAMNLERRSLGALRASADPKWEAEALDALGLTGLALIQPQTPCY